MVHRVVKHPRIDHEARAEKMKSHPGEWVKIGDYSSGDSARCTARNIKAADDFPQYVPKGAYETRVRLTDDGAVLYARYTGGTR